jgi:SRF-type transcription factor (DNA-binding and dimerisation domain)
MYDAEYQCFRRRIDTLIDKCHELAELCDLDVALIVCRKDRYYTYRSVDLDSWPPPMEKIVGLMLASYEPG